MRFFHRKNAKPPAITPEQELLAAIYLYVSWPNVTRPLTRAQKEMWADAIGAYFSQVNWDQPAAPVDRWWRDEYKRH